MSGLDAFAAGLDHASWFAAVGEALTPSELADAQGYLTGLGLSGVQVQAIADWQAAEAAIRDTAWDRRWWDAAEAQRKALLRAACAKLGEPAAMAALSKVAAAASDLVAGRAAAAAAGRADAGLIKAAAGAGTEAAYQAALALAAGAPADHAFRLRYSLFESGHWPLAVVGGRFDVF